MIKKILLPVFIAISFITCSDKKTLNDIPFGELSPESRVINFLKWYKDNEDRLRQGDLVKHGLPDKRVFYSIDFTATEKYLAELKASGYLSDKFLSDLKKHFADINEYLKQHPQDDGPPPGFEADLIMKSQDYMHVWSGIDSLKLVDKKISGNTARIELLWTGTYYLTNEKKWLIDYINEPYKIDWLVE